MQAGKVLAFIATAGGIYAAYLKQGDVSEKLATEKFDGERFQHMSALPMFQSIVCFVTALVVHLGVDRSVGQGEKGIYPPMVKYWLCGLTSTIGPAMGYGALRNISYPSQVVVKSCKMIPVMVMGWVFYGVRYSLTQWAITGTICSGLVLFSSASAPAATAKLADAHMLLGYCLCFGNLCFDGFTNSNQDVLNKKYKKNSPLHMMCYVNLWQAVFYFIWFYGIETLGYWQPLSATFDLAVRSPVFRLYLLQFCLSGALGQLFIFQMINSQGSLTNVLVTTTRKFFSILLSVFVNGTPLLPQQWVGIFMVFGGVLYNIKLKQTKNAGREKAEKAA